MRMTIGLIGAAAIALAGCSGDGDGETILAPSGNTGSNTQPAVDVSPSGSTGSSTGVREGDITQDNFPRNRIISGGVPKDGIPALTNPTFVSADQVGYLRDSDIVLGVEINGEVKAYPHNIGWWHEIVNDIVGGQAISATLCPLTGTGLVFNTTDANGGQFELGVSGLLYNNNLIMYDRRDGTTLYPQILFTAIEGARQGESLELLPVVETTWATWKQLHPDTQVVAGGTYSQSRYTSYPYINSRDGDYRTSNRYLLFGLDPSIGNNANPFSQTYEIKDPMLGVRINNRSKAYLFDTMGEQAAINDEVGGEAIVVAWDRDSSLAIPYAREVDGQLLSFDLAEGAGFPIGLVDRETGTRWDISGLAIEGELAGQQLRQIPAHNSFWFAWVSFWQETDVWQ